MKPNKELLKKFKISVGKNNIISVVFTKEESNPEDSARLAELVGAAVEEIFNKNPQETYKGLVDIVALKEKVSYLSGRVREIYAKIMADKQLKKIAIVGSSLFYRVAINFMVVITGKSENIKLFSNKNEALKWLEEN